MKHIMARYTVKKQGIEEVKRAITEFVDAVKKNEPDTLAYEAFHENDNVSFVHFMTFKDENAETAHKTTPHVMKFVEILYPLCENEPVFTELSMLKSNYRF